MAEFGLTSPAFENGEPIPREYTCGGRRLLAIARWSGVPEGTGSLALAVDDPDAQTAPSRHWRAGEPDPARISLGEHERAVRITVASRRCSQRAAWPLHQRRAPPAGEDPRRGAEPANRDSIRASSTLVLLPAVERA